MSFYQTIKEWPSEDRPREKLAKYGEQQLSVAELMAIVIRAGSRGESAVDLGRKIITRFGSLQAMVEADQRQWLDIKGLGPVKVAQIKAALEIGRRLHEPPADSDPVFIRSAKQAVDYLMPSMRHLKKEVFKILMLNARNRVLDCATHGQGTVNYAIPIIREIFQTALQQHAVSIIGAHNHPSGDAVPSAEDRDFTRKLSEAGRIMGVKVLDHVIIGDGVYYSFADEGLM